MKGNNVVNAVNEMAVTSLDVCHWTDIGHQEEVMKPAFDPDTCINFRFTSIVGGGAHFGLAFFESAPIVDGMSLSELMCENGLRGVVQRKIVEVLLSDFHDLAEFEMVGFRVAPPTVTIELNDENVIYYQTYDEFEKGPLTPTSECNVFKSIVFEVQTSEDHFFGVVNFDVLEQDDYYDPDTTMMQKLDHQDQYIEFCNLLCEKIESDYPNWVYIDVDGEQLVFSFFENSNVMVSITSSARVMKKAA